MRRFPGLVLLVPCLVILSFGCYREPPKDPTTGNLVLLLPESPEDKDRPNAISKLTVDGKDYSEPRSVKRTLQVTAKDGKDTVKVEFSFWPNTYTNIIRTKTVTLDKDKTIEVDMTKQDPDNPDLIKPIYVPTPNEVVAEMCKLANVGKDDVVYDIGCGDGRLVIMAVKDFGARKGIGIDIREERIDDCNANAKRAGVADKVEFRVADALKIKDFSEASVVLLYLGDHLNEALKPTLKSTLKPGARVVSHRFRMGDDWPPDASRTITAPDNNSTSTEFRLHLWTIK
jgi:precorrin-6B methylase 2